MLCQVYKEFALMLWCRSKTENTSVKVKRKRKLDTMKVERYLCLSLIAIKPEHSFSNWAFFLADLGDY